MNTTATDTNKPWYKQFWPWFLISLPGSVVIASIFTIIIASDKPDTVVMDDYYKQGLAINRDISREQLARKMGIKATLKMSVNHLTISLESTKKIDPGYLMLRIMHPTLADKDRQIKLNRISPLVYRAKAPAISSGNWNVRLEPGNADWRIQKRMQISGTSVQYSLP